MRASANESSDSAGQGRPPSCLVAVSRHWCFHWRDDGWLLVCLQSLRRAQGCNHVFGVSRNAVLVQIHPVEFGFRRQAQSSRCVDCKHHKHRYPERCQCDACAADGLGASGVGFHPHRRDLLAGRCCLVRLDQSRRIARRQTARVREFPKCRKTRAREPLRWDRRSSDTPAGQLQG